MGTRTAELQNSSQLSSAVRVSQNSRFTELIIISPPPVQDSNESWSQLTMSSSTNPSSFFYTDSISDLTSII